MAQIAILKGIATYNVMIPAEKEMDYIWQQKILLDLFYELNDNDKALKIFGTYVQKEI